MSAEEEVKQGFIIKDKRRFDDSGEEKPKSQAESEKPAEATAGKTGKTVESRDAAPEEVTFSSFVVSLATQAMMQLGEIKPPDGVSIPVDLESAKRMIDLLSMLQEKTRGNLDEAENNLLEDILHSLRLSFVKAKQ